MRTGQSLLCTFAALAAFGAAAAQADAPVDFSGTLTGSYANADVSGVTADLFGGDASGAVRFGEHWNMEANAGYRHVTAPGLHANDWQFGGGFFWKDGKGRIGPVAGYESVDTNIGSDHVSFEGAGGDWFLADDATISTKGGGFNGSGGLSGYYVGGGFTAYWQRDVAFSGTVDYAHAAGTGAETDYTMQGEWLVSERVPFSVYGGYTYADITSLGGHTNVWFLGVRFYTNGDGSHTLVDRQRNGPLGWSGAFAPILLSY